MGEAEFVNGGAATSASGIYGKTKVCDASPDSYGVRWYILRLCASFLPAGDLKDSQRLAYGRGGAVCSGTLRRPGDRLPAARVPCQPDGERI
jgi:hypothetical protein